MSTEPNREHVEWSRLSELAEALLTSTDPAVLDAMQDALVRAGRLREEQGIYAWGTDDERHQARFVTEWTEAAS